MSDATPPPDDELGFPLPTAAGGSRVRVAVIAAIVVGGAFAIGSWRSRAVEGGGGLAPTAARAPRVLLVSPKVVSSDRAIVLPGTVRPLEETQIFARVTGYLRTWKVDLGDKVVAGQLLAEIDAPELDAQLAQARAQLGVAQAAVKQATTQRDFSKASTARIATLADQQLVAKAQLEQQQAQTQTDEAIVASARSNVVAQEANVHRLVELQRFTRVIAPFAGTITTRTIDRGALVREGAATAMFTLVATDPVRIFIDLPQTIAPSVKTGTDGAAAAITVREYGPRVFPGKVARASGSLDPELHTMATEIQVPNADGALMPGMYVSVAITLATPHRVVELPATALYNDAQGLRVAVVDRAGLVHFAKIVIERDTGATLQIGTGLTGDERVIETAVPSLVDGDHVEVIAPPAGAAQPP